MNIAKYWRQNGARYRLEGQRHRDGTLRFPAQPLQPGETSADWQPENLARQGAVFSFTVQRGGAAGFDAAPWTIIALVQTLAGPLVTAQLTDCAPDEVAVGLPVELVVRRIGTPDPDGLLVYGYMFRPRLPEPGHASE